MIQNGGFEEAGATASVPAGWTSSFVSTLEAVADFDTNPGDPTTSQESFEGGWFADPQVLIAAFQGNTIDLETPVFNAGDVQGPLENFERGWHSPVLTLVASLPAVETAGVEGFETGWGDIAHVMGSTSTAVFEATGVPENHEDFEEGWNADTYFATPTFSAATFDTTEAVEDFEEVQAPELFTVDASDHIVFASSLAPGLGDGFRFTADADSALPSPISSTATYYSIGSVSLLSGTYSFAIGNTPNGSQVGFSSAGYGNRYIHRDPAKWWSLLLSTV